jgi:DNA-directed RNA polymerase subunit RPC12/RpoP
MLSLNQTVTYRYRCSRCLHDENVPDVVIDGFAASGGLKPGQMPRLICPTCGDHFERGGGDAPRRTLT